MDFYGGGICTTISILKTVKLRFRWLKRDICEVTQLGNDGAMVQKYVLKTKKWKLEVTRCFRVNCDKNKKESVNPEVEKLGTQSRK